MPTRPKTHQPPGQPTREERRREFDLRRAEVCEWRSWYASKRWRRARELFLLRSPKCVDCGRVFDITALEVDHEVPHRGDYELFWDVGNWRPRCKSCHSRKTGKGL